LLLGAQDDWTPAEPCLRLADAARRVGKAVTAVLYPHARHAFDAATLRGRLYVPAARGGKGATIEYDPRAHEDAEQQVKLFLQAHLKP
jgi:dienelactone hydrolase